MRKAIWSGILLVAILGVATPTMALDLTAFQAIPTSGAVEWNSFKIDGQTYLAVANFEDNSSNLNIDSKIYKWNGTSFSEFQAIPTHGAADWESLTVDGQTYLAVANYDNGSASYNIDSKIYKWNGTSFVEFQSIPTSGAPG